MILIRSCSISENLGRVLQKSGYRLKIKQNLVYLSEPALNLLKIYFLREKPAQMLMT
jgi:hypothetical protein